MLIYFGVFVKDFFWVEIAGDRPPRYGEKTHPRPVGRGPVPRRSYRARSDRGGQATALRCKRPFLSS